MKKREIKKSKIVLFIIILIVFLIIFNYKSNCKNNIDCFNKKVSKCLIPAKVVVEKNSNVFEYKSGWSFNDNCNINVKMIKVGVGFRKELAKEVEGKSMRCKVNKEKLKNVNFDNINDLLDYCSGDLKEGVYKVITRGMYTVVLKNMNEFIDEIEKASKVV